ncbi:FAD-dependent oxidoreductase [candidate division KSB1 bacterium]|nr:FAD-dependent oxidoreductase [candidate division KSB1 bacterium]
MSDIKGKILYEWLGEGCIKNLQFSDPSQLTGDPYDIAIIGAGVVGSALAYKLSQYSLRILLVDEKFDVGEGTSKGSSAIIHTGFDAAVGTLESRLVTSASLMWHELSEKLKVPFQQCGAVLVAVDDEQYNQLDKIYQKSLDNGVEDVKLLTKNEVKELVPDVSPNVRGGMSIPRESIIDAFSISIAFSEIALTNGVDILLGSRVAAVTESGNSVKHLKMASGKEIPAKIVVNVAGLGSSKIAETYGGEHFDLNPRRGQFIIFDEASRSIVNKILLPIPTAQTKGVLVIPTISGNLLAGPTAEDFELGDKSATATTIDGLELMLKGASKLFPSLTGEPRIGSFAGVRCACKQGTYQIRYNDGLPGILTVSGIRSTGVTSCPALAEYLIEGLKKECGVSLKPDPQAVDSRPESSLPGWWKHPYEKNGAVKARPDYGQIICNCENISHGEIIDALDSPLKPFTLDAIKRRTWTQTGRCQGFDCTMKIAELISEHCGIPLDKITKNGPGSEIVSR